MTMEEIESLGKVLSTADGGGCTGCVQNLMNEAREEFKFNPDEISILMASVEKATERFVPMVTTWNSKLERVEVNYK